MVLALPTANRTVTTEKLCIMQITGREQMEPRFRIRADGSLNLSDTTDATKLRQAREEKPWIRPMSPEAVVDRAKKEALIQHHGDPANRKHLLGFFEIEFGVDDGQTFKKWPLQKSLDSTVKKLLSPIKAKPCTLASDTFFQAYLLDGLARWNEDRAVAATTEGQQPRSYNHLLRHALNTLAEEVLGKKIIPYAEPRKYTDHKVVSMELPFPSTHTKPKRQIHFRKLKNINADALALDLQFLSSGSTDFLSVADSVDFYNQSLSSLLDLHAPLTSRVVSGEDFTCDNVVDGEGKRTTSKSAH
ncbi:hypothetical protein F2P81_007530 [Scophthalmus maximus]|uniref:Uncharacterized protein n=1 Tax=Scophthalmus maximus TaxID=52904 RepID=A0A6A4T2H1_SCOMX|nr:hypothetical protein F2P81_007530 [Scophthalmus maximus]